MRMKSNLRKFMKAVRRKERIKEAIRARKFSESETIAMGFAMIDFTMKFMEVTNNAYNGRDS